MLEVAEVLKVAGADLWRAVGLLTFFKKVGTPWICEDVSAFCGNRFLCGSRKVRVPWIP